jgi:DNA-binding response OmpR family regulator
LSTVLLLTSARESYADVLPSLGLLPHSVRVATAAPEHVTAGKPAPDVLLIDARRDLVQARRVLRALRAAGSQLPVLVIVTDGGWAASSVDWGADDFMLHTAGPGEVEARLRLAIGRSAQLVAQPQGEIRSGGLVINEATYSARISGRALDLTFKEFELLKFLAQYPGRVFTRAQLLQEVWGYDYFGGTRTVDVHVRRLRAKLGADNEELIGTVRNVGYRFVPAKTRSGVIADDQSGQPSPLAGDDAFAGRGGGGAGGRPGGEGQDGRPPEGHRDDRPYAPRPADAQQSAAYADS